MPNDLYEQRIKQLKQWLDNGDITGNELLIYLSQAIEEVFISEFNKRMEEYN